MRRLMVFSLAYAGAVFLAQYMLPGGWYLPAGFLCALIALALLLTPGPRRKAAALAAFGLSVGFAWCFGYNALFYAPAEPLIGQTVSFSGRVEDYPTLTDYGCKVTVRVDTDTLPVRALFYFYADQPDLRPGDRITGAAEFGSARVSREEEVTYHTAKGIYLVADQVEELEIFRPEHLPLSALPATLAHRIRGSVDALFSPEQSAFLKALLTGNRAAMTQATTTSLSRTGLSHTVAVSGMHLSYLAGFLFLLLPNRRARILCLPVLLLFTAVAGFTPSVTRAVVMQCVLILAPILRRENDPPTSLSLALLLLLVWNPYSISSISLQLSFASVAGILLFSSRIYDWCALRLGHRGEDGRVKLALPLRAILAGLAATLGATALTLPLVAWYFGTVSLIAPLSNLLTLWAVSLAFCGGMLAALAALVWPPLGQLLALPVKPMADYLLAVIDGLGGLPLAALTTGSLYVRLWLLHLYALLALTLCSRPLRRRPWLPGICSLTALICAVALTRLSYTAADLTVSVLDVEQGQSVALLSGGRAAAVDCGGSGLDSAGDILADYLQDAGLSRLDYLIFTHLHDDHANGAKELFARIRVDTLVLPRVDERSPWEEVVLRLAEEQGCHVLWLEEDIQVELGSARLTLYAPLGAGDQNEEGLSILCSAGDFDLLLTGDMTAAIEKRLLRYGDLPDIEVLVAGHHGSRHASSQELLDAVRPEVAILSVGYNSYGHPAEETLARLGSVCRDIYRTDQNGTVTVRVG